VLTYGASITYGAHMEVFVHSKDATLGKVGQNWVSRSGNIGLARAVAPCVGRSAEASAGGFRKTRILW
jgi:hypothetical protein